ncbi:MAG: aminoacyl-tRNA hydrolase [Spirochaetales bacterium]
MDHEVVRRYLAEQGELLFSRSSGPGGQHVNKTASRVQLSVDTALLPGVSDEERLRLPGRMQVAVQDERSQLTNREIAVDRLLERIVKALHRDKPRRKTKPTKASKERRLTAKKIGSTHRQNRRITED